MEVSDYHCTINVLAILDVLDHELNPTLCMSSRSVTCGVKHTLGGKICATPEKIVSQCAHKTAIFLEYNSSEFLWGGGGSNVGLMAHYVDLIQLKKTMHSRFRANMKHGWWKNCAWVMQICSYLHSLWGLLVFMRLLQIVQTSFLRAFFHAAPFLWSDTRAESNHRSTRVLRWGRNLW